MNLPAHAMYCEGPLSSSIAFIGEAPGEQEIGQGKPFVGNAGQLLNSTLHSVGLLRNQCYLDNVFQFRPQGNDISPYISCDRGNLKTSPEYLQSVKDLQARLIHSKCNVFVPLGNVPLHALTGKWGITKHRGSILPCTLPGLEGRKVIPTIHPSAALREYLYRLLIAFDLTRVKVQSSFPQIQLPERNLMVTPTYIEALQYLEYAMQQEQVGFDIEVLMTCHHMSCFSVAVNPWECMSIPMIEYGRGDYFDPDKEMQIMKALGRLLENKQVAKVGQNIIFDSSFMFKRYGIHMQNMEDTMIAMAILYPDYPKGLDIITSLYTMEPYYKDEGKMYIKNPFGDDLTFRRYNAKDSAVCIEAFPYMKRDLITCNNWDTYQRQRNLIDPLLFIQEHGFLMDLEGMGKAAVDSQLQIDDTQARLDAICGFPININSPKQMKEYFYLTRGYRPKYHGDSLTVDDDALKKLASQGSPEASLVQELRHLKKIQGTYYEMEFDKDRRMRSSFNPVGTKQGRISSSKTLFGTGGNMQNVPSEMKKYMVADPGYIICQMDLSQAENRVVAYISNETRMINAFESRIDLHRLTASLIFHKPIDQISDEKGSSTLGNGKMSERAWGKRANHALNYDLGISKFSSMYEVSLREAEFIIEQYHRAYPGVRQWHAAVREQLTRDRKLTNCFGRTRQFRERWNEELFKEAYSFVPQSTVADAMNQRGVIWLYQQQATVFKPVRIINTVHDSIVFEYPISEGPEALAEVCMALKANLEQEITWRGRSFRIPSDLAIGFNMKGLNKKNPLENPNGLEEHKSHEYQTVAGLVGRISHLYS